MADPSIFVRLAPSLAVLAVLTVLMSRALGHLAAVPGLGWVPAGPVVSLILVIVLLPGRFAALPIPFRVTGSADIEAEPDAIWRWVRPRPGRPYHGATVVSVEAVPGTADDVFLVFDERLAMGGRRGIEASIADDVEGRRLVMRYPDTSGLPLFAQDAVETEIELEPLGDGWTRVRFTEHLRAFRASALLMFLHLDPARDAARRLKAFCEGTEDPSWMGRMMREMS